MVPDVLSKPVPLTVMDWPGDAVFGVTVRVRKPTSRLNVAALVPAVFSVMVILWVPTEVAAGTTNLNGVSDAVSPLAGTAVTFELAAARAPTVVLVAMFSKAVGVKSTRSTETVEPGVAVVTRGVAPAFCTKAVVLTLEIPNESVIQTKPPADVVESTVIVPANTPLASMEPDPLKSAPPAPVVGATEFCGFNRILQSVQLAVKPPPVTVTVEPRAAVVGV